MEQDGQRGGTVARRLRPSRPPLPVRLVALALVLTAAGAAAIGTAGQVLARGYLMRQAGQELRGYVDQLTSRPFSVFPETPVAPDAARPDAGALSVVVRDAAGQLLMSAGPAALAAPAASGPPPVAVVAAGGRWLVTATPIHYQFRHIPFVFGAEDSSVWVTSAATRGSLAGTLVVGLSLAGVGRAAGLLARASLAAAGLALLLVACGAAWSVRGILRQILSATAASEAAARRRAERLCQATAETGHDLRRPLSVLHGLALYYRERGPLSGGAADRLMRLVADEAARAQALVDRLPQGRPGEPPPP